MAGDGEHTIADEMDEAPIKGLHNIELRDKRGNIREAVLELKCKRIKVLPPIGKHKRYPPLMLTVIHAQERNTPEDREAVDWKLITDLHVRSRAEAIEKLDWYALRWKAEVFHKIMKSGCKAEESKLRTAERLVNLIATFCIMSWRIFWMTMLNRSTEEISPKVCPDTTGNRLVGSFGKRQGNNPTAQEPVALPDQDRTAGRLSGTRPRAAPRQCGHVARLGALD